MIPLRGLSLFTKQLRSRCGGQKAVIAMNSFVRILSVAIFLARVSGQICVEETLDCDYPVPTIFKLGDQSCACNNAAHAGALKYSNVSVDICLGSKWKAVQLIDTRHCSTPRGLREEGNIGKTFQGTTWNKFREHGKTLLWKGEQKKYKKTKMEDVKCPHLVTFWVHVIIVCVSVV